MNDKELNQLERDRAEIANSYGILLSDVDGNVHHIEGMTDRVIDYLDRLAAAERELAEARKIMGIVLTESCRSIPSGPLWHGSYEMDLMKDWLARNAGQEGKDDGRD